MTTKKWYNQKTTKTGIAAILTALTGFLMDEISGAMCLQLIFTGGLAIFLRQGVESGSVEAQKIAKKRIRVRKKKVAAAAAGVEASSV